MAARIVSNLSFRDGPKGRTRNPYAAALRVMDSGFTRFARAPE
jgi:hypothetical protein